MTVLTVPVDGTSATDPAITGPKMASLGRLRSWGFVVPDGFTVTVAAFEAAVSGPLGEELDALVEGCDPNDFYELGARAAAAQDVVRRESVPSQVRDAIDQGYEAMGPAQSNPAVAVRSSAVAEDGTEASFAGQFLTELGVQGSADVLAAVRRCWASLFEPRALAYRLRAGKTLDECAMAVGVVELVDALASGVAFSTHPVSGSTERQVIEATFGLGEPLVSGRVIPDRAEVDNYDLRILDYSVGHKRVRCRRDPTSRQVIEEDMPALLQDRRVLTEEQVSSVAGATRSIAMSMGRPADIEWAIAGAANSTQLTLLQARPQTVVVEASPTGRGGDFLSDVFGVTEKGDA